MSAAPRVRLAPSPTGYFHVGNARNAIYNWCFARQHHGVFVLRVEDTDAERNQQAAVSGILDALEWLGTPFDEGPYFQSERRESHEAALVQLLAAGHLYACDCTRDVVEARTKGNAIPGYDGFCRDRELEPGPGRALRFKAPLDGETVVEDAVRGTVRFANATIEDFVVARSDGSPLFVLAVVVDDIEMGITHVIRSEEHLPTTPKAVLLWEALGRRPLPVFAHLSVLVNAKRQKLSKRRDRVAIEDFRAQGYLPEAMANYLALLGWSPRDGREIFSLDELVEEFSLNDVIPSPAFFDEVKLTHFNGVYLRAMTDEAFVARALPFVEEALGACSGAPATEVVARLAGVTKERVATLAEVPTVLAFALVEPFAVDPASFDRAIRRDPGARQILELAAAELGGVGAATFAAAELKAALERVAAAVGRKLGKTQAPVRVATMGATVGLPLFESLEVLGRATTLERIVAALDLLGSDAPEPPAGPPQG